MQSRSWYQSIETRGFFQNKATGYLRTENSPKENEFSRRDWEESCLVCSGTENLDTTGLISDGVWLGLTRVVDTTISDFNEVRSSKHWFNVVDWAEYGPLVDGPQRPVELVGGQWHSALRLGRHKQDRILWT